MVVSVWKTTWKKEQAFKKEESAKVLTIKS